jgi:hypothetical protein
MRESKVLVANELELLAEMSLELADRYARAAPFMEDDDGRQVALVLSTWRRSRGLYFRELSADAERTEAELQPDLARTSLDLHLSLLGEADCRREDPC